MKTSVDEVEVEKNDTFPQLRKGYKTGDIYLFKDANSCGTRLHSKIFKSRIGDCVVTLDQTDPLPTGSSLTLTQE